MVKNKMDSIRIWRSPNSRFGEWLQKENDLTDETVTANQVYTDEELAKIADSNFNAIWVHGMLRRLVKSDVFAEFGENAELHQRNMNELIERAGKYGIKVFLYLQPPRAINKNDPFWDNHPDVAGNIEDVKTNDGTVGTYISLCTSTEKVRKHLKISCRELALKLPELGGVILITAAEYPSHCWGRGGFKITENGNREMRQINCLRCLKRSAVEVVNEHISTIYSGIRSVSGDMEVIFWNWSWMAYENAPSPSIIGNLPQGSILMADFERGGEKVILGKKRIIDEYSISYCGPSERFRKFAAAAAARGLRVMAKLQFGTTHELATVPNLPLIGNLYEKARYMREQNITGFMGCWNFGNMISANTAAFNCFMNKNNLQDRQTELENFALSYFPNCDDRMVAKAWIRFAEAMDNYPFSIPFLYTGPINYTLAYIPLPGPLHGDIPCGRSWLMDKARGWDLENSLGGYSLDEITECLEKLYREWQSGLEIFEKSLIHSTGKHKKEELGTAWACCHVFRSIRNTYKIYRLRKCWTNEKVPDYLHIINDELDNLKEVPPLLENDKRLGFHGEAFDYMFNPKLVRKKMQEMQKTLIERK